jgi:hypothetical protein
MRSVAFWLFVNTLCVGCASNPVVGDAEPSDATAVCMAEVFPDNYQKSSLKILYEADGHLYTAWWVAKEAGIEPKRALMLAYYSQYPDIDITYEATPVAIKYFFWPIQWDWRDNITGRLHSLHGGDHNVVEARRNEIASILRETLQNEQLDWLSGLLIHALGDAFAHTKNAFQSSKEQAYGKRIGHAIPSLLGCSPDKICREENGLKYLGYVRSLRSVLNSHENTSLLERVCDGSEPNFVGPEFDWAHVSEESLKDKPMARFVNCMNKKVRPLSVEEVMAAIVKINSGVTIKD